MLVVENDKIDSDKTKAFHEAFEGVEVKEIIKINIQPQLSLF